MALRRWWLAVCLALALPAQAQAQEPDIVVGRADADASGGWPVALWVVDGDRSSFIVSAPREALGELPGASWMPVDAQALMSLERFSAPRLLTQSDSRFCPTTLGWGQGGPSPWPPSPHGGGGERLDLRHAACAGGACAQRQAWRIELPPGSGETLPLARLLPGLAAHAPDWLALHVVSRHHWPGLAEVRYLAVPPPLGSAGGDGPPVMPLSAAEHFPAIHTALLLHAALAQKSEAKSTLLRADAMGSIQRVGYVRNWAGSAEEREALGVQSASLGSSLVARLLLRLHPADRPATLSLMARIDNPGSNFRTLRALMPEPATAEACRDRLTALRCQPACAERVADVQVSLARGWWVDSGIERLALRRRLAACLQSCDLQKRRVEEDMAVNFKAMDERQQRGWQWVEAMTGRAAAHWQRQP